MFCPCEFLFSRSLSSFLSSALTRYALYFLLTVNYTDQERVLMEWAVGGACQSPDILDPILWRHLLGVLPFLGETGLCLSVEVQRKLLQEVVLPSLLRSASTGHLWAAVLPEVASSSEHAQGSTTGDCLWEQTACLLFLLSRASNLECNPSGETLSPAQDAAGSSMPVRTFQSFPGPLQLSLDVLDKFSEENSVRTAGGILYYCGR